MNNITESNNQSVSDNKISQADLNKKFQVDLKDLLKKCYQCARCSGVCQLSKVQKFRPSRIIQRILEGFEEKVLESGVLWNCLMCNTCLKKCPEEINFADIVRIAKYKMRNQLMQNSEDYLAHRGIYTSISEIMAQSDLVPKRNLNWIPDDIEISDSGSVLYHIGCIPFFKFEFDELDSIPIDTLKILSQIEKDPIVVLKNENCCGHDLYWGQGKMEAFLSLAQKNIRNFNKARVSKIITTCIEGYRTFKIDYPKYFESFKEKYEINHIIEYLDDKLKKGLIELKVKEDLKEKIKITFHDPCRLSRFLPKDNKLMTSVRNIFKKLDEKYFKYREMEHYGINSLCCGVSSWLNCNEKSKALRYKRLSEAVKVADILVTICPKCIMHFNCLKNDYEKFSKLEIMDFVEFISRFVEIKLKKIESEKK